MKKTIFSIILGIALCSSLWYWASKETERVNQIRKYQEEMFQMAVQKMIDGQEEDALTTLEECADHPGKALIKNICKGMQAYKEDRILDAYDKVRYHTLNSYDYLSEEQNIWVVEKIKSIKTAKENYDKEQAKQRAERKAQEEAEKLQRLKESGIPYVGMSEKLIAETSLGAPRSTVRHNYETIAGKVYMANLYDFPRTGYVTFSARCVRGTVTEIFDGRGNGGVNPKYLTSSGSGSSGSKKYSTAEDLYEDHPDEFDSLEDAENYFDDHY